MNQYLKKYFICLIFTVDLTLLVLLSEILRYVMTASSQGITSGNIYLIGFGSFLLLAFMMVIIPLTLLLMWILNPLAMKKLLIQFGLNEKSLDKKRVENKEPEKLDSKANNEK
jgi:hypothetical protein